MALVAYEEITVAGELVRNEANGFVGSDKHRVDGARGEVLHLCLRRRASGQDQHLQGVDIEVRSCLQAGSGCAEHLMRWLVAQMCVHTALQHARPLPPCTY